MLSLGDGVAIGMAFIAICGLIIKYSPSKKNNDIPCKLHSGISATLEFLKAGQERIEEKIDRIIEGG
jgi:hypothetical protein